MASACPAQGRAHLGAPPRHHAHTAPAGFPSSLTWCRLLGAVSSRGAHRRPPAAPLGPPWHGRSPQGTARGRCLTEVAATAAARGVPVLQRLLHFLPLRINHSLCSGHHLTQSPLHLRNAAASSRHPLRAPSSVGRCWPAHGGLASPASPQERRPQPRGSRCGQPEMGNGCLPSPGSSQRDPLRLQSPSAPSAGQGWNPAERRLWRSRCGGAGALTGTAGRGQRGVGVTGCCGGRAGPAAPGPASRSVPGPAPSPEGGTALPPSTSNTGPANLNEGKL